MPAVSLRLFAGRRALVAVVASALVLGLGAAFALGMLVREVMLDASSPRVFVGRARAALHLGRMTIMTTGALAFEASLRAHAVSREALCRLCSPEGREGVEVDPAVARGQTRVLSTLDDEGARPSYARAARRR